MEEGPSSPHYEKPKLPRLDRLAHDEERLAYDEERLGHDEEWLHKEYLGGILDRLASHTYGSSYGFEKTL